MNRRELVKSLVGVGVALVVPEPIAKAAQELAGPFPSGCISSGPSSSPQVWMAPEEIAREALAHLEDALVIQRLGEHEYTPSGGGGYECPLCDAGIPRTSTRVITIHKSGGRPRI